MFALLQAGVCYLTNRLAVSTHLPLVNLDCLLVLMAGSLGLVGAGVAALSVILGLCAMVSEVFGYPFLVFAIPELWINVPYFPWPVQAAVAVAACLSMALVVLALKVLRWERTHLLEHRNRHRPGRAGLLICLVAVAAWGAEAVSGFNFFGSTFLTHRQQLLYLVKTLASNDLSQAFAPLPLLDSTDAVNAAARRHEDVVVVVVESLGEMKDASLQGQLDRTLLNAEVLGKYQVRRAQHAFHGSTIDGEFRELCNVRLQNLFFSSPPSGCMPSRLAAAGYRTEALHGNDAHFYRRAAWYPAIGIQEVVDLNRLPGASTSHCGGMWNGYCDLDLLEVAGRPAPGASPRLTYVLTLNTHLPATPMTRGRANLTGCRGRYRDEVCVHLENTQRVLAAIADMAVRRAPATVVVVGDHAPPFALDSDRQLFDADKVPSYLLQPR